MKFVSPSMLDSEILAGLYELAAGDSDFLADLFKHYLTETPKSIANLRQAVATVDMAALEHAAHVLKGASLYIGAGSLATPAGSWKS